MYFHSRGNSVRSAHAHQSIIQQQFRARNAAGLAHVPSEKMYLLSCQMSEYGNYTLVPELIGMITNEKTWLSRVEACATASQTRHPRLPFFACWIEETRLQDKFSKTFTNP
jgi:hypothetical protein